MQLLDPNLPSTWRNHPAPRLDPSLVAEVEGMLGKNTFGKPILRIEWGQTRMAFQRGKDRLKYVDRRIPPIEKMRHVLCRPSLLDDSGKPIQWEREILKEAPKVVPEGWTYVQELAELEFIGDQLFYIEQWVPPHLLGETPESWEAIRYEPWEDPEIGFIERCDVLGPFPSEGQYRDVFAIGEPYVYPAFTDEGEPYEGEYLRFRMPGADTLEALREKIFRRENEPLPSAEQRGKDRFYNYNRHKEREFDKYRAERRAWFHDALNTTGKREALAKRMAGVPATPPVSMNIPLEFPKEQAVRELQNLNRHQRRKLAKLERKAA